jgi:hypothetical protein
MLSNNKQQGERTDLVHTIRQKDAVTDAAQETFTNQSSPCYDKDGIDHDELIHDNESSNTDAWPARHYAGILYTWIVSLLWCLWSKLTSSLAQSRPSANKKKTVDELINEWMKDPNFRKRVEIKVQATEAERRRQDDEREERRRARKEEAQRKIEANRQASLERRRKRREEFQREKEEDEREWKEWEAQLEQRPKPWDIREPSDVIAYMQYSGATEEDCKAMENRILYELGEGGEAGGGGSVCDFLLQMEDEAVKERQRVRRIHRDKLQECMKELTARTTSHSSPR